MISVIFGKVANFWRIRRFACWLGVMFEVATICGVPQFDQDHRQLTTYLAVQGEKIALLPKAVRTRVKGVKDDF